MNDTIDNKVQTIQARLGARLDYVVPIFVPTEVAFFLSNMGYEVTIDQTNNESFQALKASSQIYLDGSRRVFGVRSDNFDNCVSTMSQLYSVLRNHLEVDLKKYVVFYEVELIAYYFTGEDVYENLKSLYNDSSDMHALNKILGGNYSQISIKVAPSGNTINSKEWEEITIEPKVNSTGKTFTIRMICRNPKLRKVTDYAVSANEKISRIVEHVLLKRKA